MTAKIMSLVDVSKSFLTGKEKTMVLNRITMDIYAGDFTVIMGPSGAGKSTLLYVLSGMERASSGKVIYQNQELNQRKEEQMAKLRANDFGFVFQQANLVSNLTLEENILVAGYMKKEHKESDVKERTNQLLEKINIAGARKRLPSDVSGGEAQRVAVARAVINQPSVVFADEPTGALNRQNTLEILELFGTLHKDGQSIVMVTHDIRAALCGNRILYLEDGAIKGEKLLPVYEKGQDKLREKELQTWLSSMEW